jgi:ubiquinone/menaquinone biosynthesis C-methylase UbiE
MGPVTEAFLVDSGITAGMTCADVGCGARHVSRTLAALVGPSGRVVGLDLDEVKLATAREEASRAGLRNVEFRTADVNTWSEPAAYDVVYARFVLAHLTDRPGVLARMRDALRASGMLIVEDVDFTGAFCHPANAAYDRLCQLFVDMVGRRGGDANVGAKLYQLCLDAGLDDVHAQVVHPAHYGTVPEKGMMLNTLVNIAEGVVATGLASADEVRDTIAGLTAYTEDPRTIVACPRIFQARGRKRNG